MHTITTYQFAELVMRSTLPFLVVGILGIALIIKDIIKKIYRKKHIHYKVSKGVYL